RLRAGALRAGFSAAGSPAGASAGAASVSAAALVVVMTPSAAVARRGARLRGDDVAAATACWRSEDSFWLGADCDAVSAWGAASAWGAELCSASAGDCVFWVSLIASTRAPLRSLVAPLMPRDAARA